MGMTQTRGALARDPETDPPGAWPLPEEDASPLETPAPVVGTPRPNRRQQQPVAIIRIARIWPGGERAVAQAPALVHADPLNDSLDAFGSEAVVVPIQRPVPVPAAPPVEKTAAVPFDRTKVIVALKWAAVIVLSASTALAGAWASQRRNAPPLTGSVTIQTTPPGLEVRVDGRASGLTPVTLALAPASYAIQVGSGPQQRNLAVDVQGGASIVQHLEVAPLAAAVPVIAHGGLRVQTVPPGQAVLVDDVLKGNSPVTVDELSPGDHTVVVKGSGGSIRRTVSVKAGETLSLVISPSAPAAPAPGWLSVQAATRLELRQYGKLIGTTDTEQLMLAAGEHDIELVNEAVGYRSMRKITVAPGKTTTLAVELPFGSLSLNAQPWAEVWIGGERIGETPIANLSRRVGSYEITFRHPELGERRETVLVTLRQPSRLGVDMRSK